MNLKKSKFYKRIQALRQSSREKLRKERERNRIEWELANVFNESAALPARKYCESCAPHEGPNETTKERKTQSKCSLNNCNNQSSEHFDNTSFYLKSITNSNFNKADKCTNSMPSISSIRGSICVTNSRYTLISKIAKSLGFKIATEDLHWNILWADSMPGVETYKNMKRFQQINHFPGMLEICRKDLLSRNLNRMLKLYPKDFKIFPKTWIFPADYGEALSYEKTCSKEKTFILKPDAGTQGRGIWLTNDLKSISPFDRMICQTYIKKPLLIDGYKFDLRVYALVTSVDPLRIYVYNEGLARFATNKYVKPCPDNNTDRYMHLTNYSVNKRNSQYDLCDYEDCGSKRKFSAITNWMLSQNYNVEQFWSKIDDIIIKTILSAGPMLKHNYHACFPGHDKIQACFEILGFDILVDSKLKPYVLEVNHSPSFHTNESVDRDVKKPLIRDTLILLSTALADKRKILREDRKRVKQRLLKRKQGSGKPSPEDAPMNNCPLSALSQQIAWEESHLGDFRRVMPPNDPEKLNYYCQFYGQQNQVSIFAETATSKKREEVSKKLRCELEEKKRKQIEMLKQKCNLKLKLANRNQKRYTLPRAKVERQRQMTQQHQSLWKPDFISACEERIRLMDLKERNKIVQDLKIKEMIFLDLYKMRYLNTTDIIKYGDLYASLENNDNILEK